MVYASASIATINVAKLIIITSDSNVVILAAPPFRHGYAVTGTSSRTLSTLENLILLFSHYITHLFLYNILFSSEGLSRESSGKNAVQSFLKRRALLGRIFYAIHHPDTKKQPLPIESAVFGYSVIIFSIARCGISASINSGEVMT